jgi:hypothetical protein
LGSLVNLYAYDTREASGDLVPYRLIVEFSEHERECYVVHISEMLITIVRVCACLSLSEISNHRPSQEYSV